MRPDQGLEPAARGVLVGEHLPQLHDGDALAVCLAGFVPQTAAQFRAADERYTERADQMWGLTDCASSIVMEERGITDALAHDRDFEQAGLTALLRRND